jgi:hypothetical protein
MGRNTSNGSVASGGGGGGHTATFGSNASSPMPLQQLPSPGLSAFSSPGLFPSSGSPSFPSHGGGSTGGGIASPVRLESNGFTANGMGGFTAASGFPSAGNQAMFPHLTQQQHVDDWPLPLSPSAFFTQAGTFDPSLPSDPHGSGLHPSLSNFSSPQFNAMQSPDAFTTHLYSGGGVDAGHALGLSDLDPDDLVQDMSFSQGHEPEDEAGFDGTATAAAGASSAAASSHGFPTHTSAAAASNPNYPASSNPLEAPAEEWQEGGASGEGGGDEEDEDEEMTSNKKRKLAAYRGAKVSQKDVPLMIPPNARVCELGLLNKQVTGNLCWTSYQKLSATDRSCLALLCAAHSDETNLAPGQPRYTQYVPRDRLLQLGLTIEKKPLEKILTQLQQEQRIERAVLVMRIRRAIQGKVKTGPEHCLLLLFPSKLSRDVAAVHLSAHVEKDAERAIGFPAELTPFSCDFTKRCVWIVPKHLCIGGTYMIPASEGALQFATTPAAAAAAVSEGTLQGQHAMKISGVPETPMSPSQSIISHDPSHRTSSTAAAAAGGPSSTALPSFSALSLGTSSSAGGRGGQDVEEQTFAHVLQTLKNTHKIHSVLASEDPYSHLQLAFNALENEAVEKFKRFPQRALVWSGERPIDVFVSKQIFLQHALEVLLDLTWADQSSNEREVALFAPMLHSLFLIISLPSSGLHASSLTFTQWMRLYSWLRPSVGHTKPRPSEGSSLKQEQQDDSDDNGWVPTDYVVDPKTHRSPFQLHVIGQLHKLLFFLHKSLKFFQAYIPSHLPGRFVFATRAHLESDTKMTMFSPEEREQARKEMMERERHGGGGGGSGGDAQMMESTGSNNIHAYSHLAFHPQIRFNEGHLNHLSEDSHEALHREIVLSYTCYDPKTDHIRKMEHVPLMREGAAGVSENDSQPRDCGLKSACSQGVLCVSFSSSVFRLLRVDSPLRPALPFARLDDGRAPCRFAAHSSDALRARTADAEPRDQDGG